MKQYFAKTLQVISIKKHVYACTDEVREKVSSFQKVTLFLRYKPYNRALINFKRFCLFEDVTGYRDIRRMNLKSFVSIDSSFLLLKNIRQTLLAS